MDRHQGVRLLALRRVDQWVALLHRAALLVALLRLAHLRPQLVHPAGPLVDLAHPLEALHPQVLLVRRPELLLDLHPEDHQEDRLVLPLLRVPRVALLVPRRPADLLVDLQELHHQADRLEDLQGLHHQADRLEDLQGLHRQADHHEDLQGLHLQVDLLVDLLAPHLAPDLPVCPPVPLADLLVAHLPEV